MVSAPREKDRTLAVLVGLGLVDREQTGEASEASAGPGTRLKSSLPKATVGALSKGSDSGWTSERTRGDCPVESLSPAIRSWSLPGSEYIR